MASPAELNHSVRFGVFELDLRTRELRTKRRKLSLQEQPFLILALLLERPGQLVTREELVKRVWTSDTFVDFDHSLNKAVNRLREVLGDSADNPRFIETLPRRGYRFIAPITGNGSVEPAATVSLSSFPEGTHEWPAGPGSSVSAEEAVSTPSCQIPATSGKRRSMYAITIAVLVVGATGFVIHKSLSHNRVLDLRNMQITKLTDNGRVREIAISPDGHYVAYALRNGIDQSLWMREVGAVSEVQLLVPDSVSFSGLTFSPDGNSIYFIRSENSNPVFSYLYKMPATGGSVQQLVRDADSPVSFSPDGQRFVYTRGNPPQNVFEVRTAKADGSGDALLKTLHGFQVYEAGATWSPDGRTITVPVQMIEQQSQFVLYAISVVDGTVRELYSSAGSIGRPLWIRHGRGLLVSLEDPRSHRGQLWAMSYPEGEMHRFTNDLSDYSPAIDLTSDGRTLATIVTTTMSNMWAAPAEDLSRSYQITSGEPSLFQVRELPDRKLLALGDGLWIMNSDGSQRSRFVEVPDPQGIEPCGRFVVFISSDSGKTVLMRAGLDGASPTVLASGDLLSPACSPEGEFVFYLNFAHPEKIRRIPIQGGLSSDVADVLGDTLFGTLSISPDGKSLAYPYQQYSPPLVALAVIPAIGGPAVKTFRVPGSIGRLRWSPDGDALQYLLTRDGATNLWEQRVSGAKPKQLTRFNSGDIFDFSWSADHKRLLLTRGEMTRDVVLVGDLR